MKSNLTQAELKRDMNYNPQTGHFLRTCPRKQKRYGRIAGSPNPSGYIQIKIGKFLYYAHRLAFLYMTGSWPQYEVDHVNGRPGENKWVNLRQATHQQNGSNVKTSLRNTSGSKGVYFDRPRSKWVSQISINGRKLFLGRHVTKEAAKARYEQAARELFGEFIRTEQATLS